MSFQKYKTDSFCVGQKHYSGSKNIVGEITFNKQTGREYKLLIGQCSVPNRKKIFNVSDNTMQVEGLSDFFKNLGKSSVNVGNKLAKNVLKNPSRALDFTAIIATAAASRSPKNVSSTLPEVINFYHTGKGLYLPRFIKLYTL